MYFWSIASFARALLFSCVEIFQRVICSFAFLVAGGCGGCT